MCGAHPFFVMDKDKNPIKKQRIHIPKAVRIVLGFMFGLLASFVWHRVVGCSSGACPITSNYLYSLGAVGLFGIILSLF